MATDYWIGVDLGGTKTLAGVFNAEFQLLARGKRPTDAATGPDAIFNQIRQLVDGVLQEAGLKPGQISGLGIGIPGQIDPHLQRVRFAPNLGWKNLELPKVLPTSWPWPCICENDVKLGTYGEFMHGAAKGAKHVLGIFVGTGVGGGLILDGDIFHGFNFNAGEIGHTILHWRKGTELEGLAGRACMMKRANELLPDAPKAVRKAWKGIDVAGIKSSHLAELCQKGDPIAQLLADDAARALGAAVASALNFLSPEVIVIGGGVAGALGEPFLERIWEVAQRFVLPNVTDGVRFVPAALGDNSGIYGAGAYARDHIKKANAAV